MTCIAGFIENKSGKVFIGGDSAGVGGYSLSIRKQPKVFRVDEFIFGYTSSFRMGQIIEHYFSTPEKTEGMDDFAYMVKRVVPHIKSLFRDHGYGTEKDGEFIGGVFLIGYNSRLYEIQSDFQVGENISMVNGVGCGDDLAMGAMSALEDSGLSGKDIVMKALKIAESMSAGVRGPFHIVSL